MGRHVYVHNPFCISKCPYCDFYSLPCVSGDKIRAFYKTCLKETEYLASEYKALEDDYPDTVYFGGGTPSYPEESYITELLKTITDSFGIGDCEKTIEVNPSSLTMEKAESYLRAGFNRASVGIQSLDDNVLRLLGRRHDSQGALRALDILKKAGFTNISVDLITGVPGESIGGIRSDCIKLARAGVKHISTYSLMICEGTSFYSIYKDTLEDIVSPDQERAMYHETMSCLSDLGFVRYEISNSCLPGYESRHNSSYWEGFEYYGIGAGAHGYLDSVRYGHKDDIDDYIRDFKANVYIEEQMTPEDKMREYPFLKLRTLKGIDRARFSSRFGADIYDVFGDAIKENMTQDLLEECDGFIRLTKKGLDLADLVAESFL